MRIVFITSLYGRYRSNVLFYIFSYLQRPRYIRDYEDDLKVLHLIRGGLGAPLQLICQIVLITYGIQPLTDDNSHSLEVTDWQGNAISITILTPASIVLSTLTVLKVN